MTKHSVTLFLLLLAGLCAGQTVCSLKNLHNIDKFSFDSVTFISESNTVDSVSYNCIATCWHSKAKILGNLDVNGHKQGHFVVYDNKGDFFVAGNFVNDLMEGWWSYGGCCSTLFNRGKKIRTVCATF